MSGQATPVEPVPAVADAVILSIVVLLS